MSAQETLQAVKVLIMHPPEGASDSEIVAGLRGFLRLEGDLGVANLEARRDAMFYGDGWIRVSRQQDGAITYESIHPDRIILGVRDPRAEQEQGER